MPSSALIIEFRVLTDARDEVDVVETDDEATLCRESERPNDSVLMKEPGRAGRGIGAGVFVGGAKTS